MLDIKSHKIEEVVIMQFPPGPKNESLAAEIGEILHSTLAKSGSNVLVLNIPEGFRFESVDVVSLLARIGIGKISHYVSEHVLKLLAESMRKSGQSIVEVSGDAPARVSIQNSLTGGMKAILIDEAL